MTRIPRISPFNCCITRLVFSGINGAKSHGTGFLYRKYGQPYIVTNWHCVTGRDAITKNPIGSFLPHTISYKMTALCNQDAMFMTFDQNLYLDEERKFPCWLEHPSFRGDVDIVCIAISRMVISEINDRNNKDQSKFFELKFMNEIPNHLNDIDFGIGSDVIVAGYPFVEDVYYSDFPIWKGGIISTEPHVNFNENGYFFVDARTSVGMSGSPVLAMAKGCSYVSTSRVMVQGVDHGGRVVGIYAGRKKDRDGGHDLARVWNYDLISEIIDGQTAGKSSFYLEN